MNETLKHVMDDIEAEQAAIISAVNTAAISKSGEERRDFRIIRQETGISSSWLSLFADGGIREPGYKRTRLLKAWLRLNGFLAATTPEHDMTMINVPIPADEAPAKRSLARREYLSPGAATFCCSPLGGNR